MTVEARAIAQKKTTTRSGTDAEPARGSQRPERGDQGGEYTREKEKEDEITRGRKGGPRKDQS